jgi:hypothetical protein
MPSTKTLRFNGADEEFVATKMSNGQFIEKSLLVKNGEVMRGCWINSVGDFADLSLEDGWELVGVSKDSFIEVKA